MSPIPMSDIPGYKRLHELVYGALDLSQESQAVEFKGSAAWDSLKWRVIRTAMAMGNLRDGGIIIIGVAEVGDKWDLGGIETTHLATYDADDVIDITSSYASPPLGMKIARTKYSNNREFLILQVDEFDHTPHVCKKNGPAGSNLFEGELYIRPPGKPQTKKVSNAQEMQDLLELAAEKKARTMIETFHRIGITSSPTPGERFNAELEGL